MEDFLNSALTWCDEKREQGVQDELSGGGMSPSSTLPRLILPFCLSGLLPPAYLIYLSVR